MQKLQIQLQAIANSTAKATKSTANSLKLTAKVTNISTKTCNQHTYLPRSFNTGSI